MLGISKEQLSQLPVASFPGRHILINSVADCKPALAYLCKQPIVGFDTETRPSFRKGHVNKVSLLQLSTFDECFLFRLNITGLTDEMVRLFESESVMKVGLSIKDDFHQLNVLREFNPANSIELQQFVKDYGIADNSLQKVYGIVFGQRISKAQRLTNWEAAQLTEQQQAYASLDAFACLRLYTYLSAGAFNPDASPYQLPDETAPAVAASTPGAASGK